MFQGHVIWNLQLILGSFKLSMSKLELILLPSWCLCPPQIGTPFIHKPIYSRQNHSWILPLLVMTHGLSCSAHFELQISVSFLPFLLSVACLVEGHSQHLVKSSMLFLTNVFSSFLVPSHWHVVSLTDSKTQQQNSVVIIDHLAHENIC